LAILALKISVAALLFVAGPVSSAGAVSERTPGEGEGAFKRVTIMVVPQPLLPEDLEVIQGAAVGLMNPGLGDVSADQTWLDVSQGARVFDSKYDTSLDTLSALPPFVSGWEEVVARAESAGLEIHPGFLGSLLRRNGLDPGVAGPSGSAGSAGLAVTSLTGRLSRAPDECPGPDCYAPVTVSTQSLTEAARFSTERRAGELMIVIEGPPAESGDQLAIAIAGPGFSGMLRSASTRTPGYVLTTDIAPTVLRHFDLGTPPAMSGLAIGSGGQVDFAALADLEVRYQQVGKSKGTAMLFPLLAWFLLAGALILFGGRRRAVLAAETLCIAVILLPAVLLLTATLSPSAGLESLLAGVVPIVAALLLIRLMPGWQALAVGCAVTVLAFSIDLVAGLALTPKAVIGPNPGLGARFYGIGNELESTLMVLTSIGTGAALQAWGQSLRVRGQAAAFLVAGLAGTVIFASGQFGADVGAAIIFPVAAVVGAAMVLGRPRLVWLGLVAAVLGLVLLALADVFTGAETHFVRSVFEGGSGDSAFDVVAHRLGATADSFTSFSRLPVTLVALALIESAWLKRSRLEQLLLGLDPLRAGLIAAAAGSLIGALTNDSGALFIHVGVLYTGLTILFVRALRPKTAAV
jgi:hypothetical protein